VDEVLVADAEATRHVDPGLDAAAQEAGLQLEREPALAAALVRGSRDPRHGRVGLAAGGAQLLDLVGRLALAQP